jgi:tetratricopeptide (TPR) repeat protein
MRGDGETERAPPLALRRRARRTRDRRARVRGGLLERGQCAEGKKRLLKLLDEHPKAPYVVGRRIQLEELARQLAFGAAVPPVEARNLISGELVQWNPKDGTIKLRYRGGADMKDWEKSGSFLLHPAPFRGPHSITIKGDRYPDKSGIVEVCWSKDRSILVIPGVAPFTEGDTQWSGIPTTIEMRTGEETDAIGGGGESPFDRRRSFTLGVVVNATQVSCYYGNKAVARATKDAGVWGSISLIDFDDCDIVIQGKVELSWIQGLVDKERQERLAEFSRRWEPKDDLPAWLFEALPASEADDPLSRTWPIALQEPAFSLVKRALDLRRKGEAAAALELVDEAAAGSIPDTTLDYLRGMLLQELGRDEEAAAACRRVREKDPDFVPAALIETEALVTLGRMEEALAIYRDLLARFPRAADLHATAALFLGASGRWEEADRLVAAAMTNGVSSKDLEAASRVVHKAVHGPGWPRPHDCESAHYVVCSDMDAKVCSESSKVLEQAYAVFVTRLERPPATKEKFKVYLFSGQAGYQAHIADLLGESVPHSAGLYAPALRQLFIWNLPEREDMMRTVRHEGFHQYLHRIMRDPPLWFNEGLAEYFESAKIVDGKWTTGFPRRDHLEMLELAHREKQDPARLRDFLFLDDKAFMEKAFVDYPQAWAFIHFLLHTTRENRQLFDRFWDSFKRIPAHADAIRAALGDRSLEAMERDFEAHIEEMRKG